MVDQVPPTTPTGESAPAMERPPEVPAAEAAREPDASTPAGTGQDAAPVEAPAGTGQDAAPVEAPAGTGQDAAPVEAPAGTGQDAAPVEAPAGTARAARGIGFHLPPGAGYVLAGLAGVALTFAFVVFTGFGTRGSNSAATGAPTGSGGPAASSEASASQAAHPSPSQGSIPIVPGAIPEQGNVLGRPDAPLTIEIWSDFQCPFCSLFAHGIEPALTRDLVAPGAARLVYRDYAFLGSESIDASVAARCAGQQGAFWAYHDLLFATQRGENQGTFSQKFLADLADFIGLDKGVFATCMADQSVRSAVNSETQEAQRLGVDSTPTIRLIGPAGTEAIAGFPSWAAITAAIDRVMGRAPASPSPRTGAPSPGASPAASSAAGSSSSSAPSPVASS